MTRQLFSSLQVNVYTVACYIGNKTRHLELGVTLVGFFFSQILREVPAFDVAYTCIVVSHTGRMVFTGTSSGAIRSMKYPLPVQREFNEYPAHHGPVTKVKAKHTHLALVMLIALDFVYLFFFLSPQHLLMHNGHS